MTQQEDKIMITEKARPGDMEEILSIYAGARKFMAERGNLGELSAVIDAFVNAAENKLNVSIVDVVTAVALDDELRGIITEKLSKDLGKPVVLCETVDKSILGGIIMSTNGKRIDASISSKLEGTRALLKENNDGGEC